MTTALRDIYQTVTDQIIAALEAGTPPWICPWQGSDADMAPPTSAAMRHNFIDRRRSRSIPAAGRPPPPRSECQSNRPPCGLRGRVAVARASGPATLPRRTPWPVLFLDIEIQAAQSPPVVDLRSC
jgi:hypothetical protein